MKTRTVRKVSNECMCVCVCVCKYGLVGLGLMNVYVFKST